MYHSRILYSLIYVFILGLGAACDSSSASQPKEKENTSTIPLSDYVGKYDVEKTKDRVLIDVYIKGDSLYLYSPDKGISTMHLQKNEVYDVPRVESKLRFMRNDEGAVDRVIMLTPKGRYIAAKMHPDSAKLVVDTTAIKFKKHQQQIDSLKALYEKEELKKNSK